jgi:hypothetical protein
MFRTKKTSAATSRCMVKRFIRIPCISCVDGLTSTSFALHQTGPANIPTSVSDDIMIMSDKCRTDHLLAK